jgi:hypothetical protein
VAAWHDFFMLTGTVAATLAGLVFVSVSLGAGVKVERTRGDLDAWVTPSLVHFIIVLVISAAALAPLEVATFAYLALGLLAIGVPYGAWRMRYFFQRNVETKLGRTTWVWQVVLPASAQAGIAGGGIALAESEARGVMAIGAGAVLLLVVAVRNAWSVVTWFLEQRG